MELTTQEQLGQIDTQLFDLLRRKRELLGLTVPVQKPQLITLDQLKLRNATRGWLRSGDCNNVHDVLKLGSANLRRLGGVGNRLFNEVEEALEKHGYSLDPY